MEAILTVSRISNFGPEELIVMERSLMDRWNTIHQRQGTPEARPDDPEQSAILAVLLNEIQEGLQR